MINFRRKSINYRAHAQVLSVSLKRAYGKREKRKRLPALEQLAGFPEAADE
jgi:hypothetical protein